MRKKLIAGLLAVVALVGAVVGFSGTVYADDTYAQPAVGRCDYFLGMVSWDCGVVTDNINSEDALKGSIVQIAVNVLSDISVIAAYLVLGYVIYGGYLYTFSGGDPGKVANGKKTLSQAFIGLAIVMSATAIFGAMRITIASNYSSAYCRDSLYSSEQTCLVNVDPGNMVESMISWFIGIAGLVSAVYVVYGGIMYVTSAGDPNKLQKAKQMITYALIGLAICGLAEIIVAFVGGMIHDANSTSLIKEVYEKTIG